MKLVVVVGVLAVLVALTYAAPVSPEDQNLLQFDENEILDAKDVWYTDVPCDFCNDSIPVLLEICRGSGGRSTEHVEDFLTRCTQIGGLHPTKLELMMRSSIQSEEDPRDNNVNFIYNRRHRCAKIYRGLLQLYDPFDPCVQILRDFQNNPMTVCRAATIDCKTENDLKPPEYFIPPYKTNASIAYQPPPLKCQTYVSVVVEECKKLKKNDFYARSDLDGWCNGMFNGEYQRLGCQTIVSKMTERDTLMDLCSGLKIFPIDKQMDVFCENSLNMTSNAQVDLEEYKQYMATVENVGKLSEYQRLLAASTQVPAQGTLLLP